MQYIAKCVCSGSDVTGPITKSARTTCGKCPTTVKKGASCSTGKRICSGANVARCHKGKWKIRECSGDRFCQVHNQNGKCSKPKGILNPCSNSVGQGGSSISIPTTQATGSSPTLVDPAFISVVSVFSTVFVTSCDRATATTEQGSGATSIVIPPPYFYSEAGYGDYSVPVPSTSKTSSLSRKTRSRSRTRRLSTTSSAFGSGNTDVPIPSIPETCTESASEIGSGQTTVAIPSSSSVLATPTCKTEASGSGNTDVSLPSLTSPLSRHHSKSRHHHLKSSSADYGSGNTDVSIPSSTVCITLTSTILGSGNSDFSVPTDAPSYILHRSRHHYWNHSTELNYYSFPTSEAEGSAQTSLVAPPSFATSTACDYCGRFKKACRVYCRNVSKGADFALVNQCYNEFSSCVCNGVDLSIGIESEVDEQAPEEQTC